MRRNVLKVLNTVFKNVAPHNCVACGEVGSVLCDVCFDAKVPPLNSTCYRCNRMSNDFMTCRSCRSSSPIFSVHKLSLYEGAIKKAIHKTKFEAARSGADELGEFVARLATDLDADVVTYVPTVSSRIRQRGFDHAKQMAMRASLFTGIPFVKALNRESKGRQYGASRSQRKAQIKNTFAPANTFKVSGNRVLLVDDVISTGATIEEAARVLKLAGAKRIYVVVAAHNR